MWNAGVLIAALEIIEKRIKEQMSAADLARSCYSSCSGLRKLFSYAFGCSVREYITKRRLSIASMELLSCDRSITDIALDYQYGSPEAFSRAFKRFWGISPSEFRKTRRFSELQPKFKFENEYGGIDMLGRKPVDISELYDELKKLGGTYLFGIDIVNFGQVNKEYSYTAGDIVIAEAFARIERELGEGMLLFRVGGDEFAVVTGYSSLTDAQALARRITGHNGKTVKYGALDIPLSLRVGISRVPEGTLSYQGALNIMSDSIDKARNTEDYVAVYFEE